MLRWACDDVLRIAFGFGNPNHAAALVCSAMPLCWRGRCAWLEQTLFAALFAALLLTQSRTGLLVAGAEAVAWRWLRTDGSVRPEGRRIASVGLLLALAAAWWLWPRLALDGSVLNRPKIWLAGLRLFAANPEGVGLGNSGAVASAFLLEGIPEVRTMVSAHVTLLAEFGALAGWAWFAFIVLALRGVRTSPRAGIAFAGLALSACSSTVFDWPVLLDLAGQGGLGMLNWTLSWATLALFLALGARLAAGAMRHGRNLRPIADAAVLAGLLVLGLRLVPSGNAPQVRDGYVLHGKAPRTLALYDETWTLRAVAGRLRGGMAMPVRGIAAFPHALDRRDIGGVVLFGNCREWKRLVADLPTACAEEE